jgi:hypothetical protein
VAVPAVSIDILPAVALVTNVDSNRFHVSKLSVEGSKEETTVIVVPVNEPPASPIDITPPLHDVGTYIQADTDAVTLPTVNVIPVV